MSSFSSRLLLPVVLGALFVAGCSSRSQVEAATAVKARNERKVAPSVLKPAPDFVLKDANGASVKLSDYKGKVVILDFWATWCGPCKIEIPWFIEFERTFKDRGFAVVGVSMDEDGWAAVKPYIQERKVNYRILLGNDKVADLYGGVDALPTTYLIDRSGRIASKHVGLSSSKEEFKNEINQLLGARGASNAPLSNVPAFLAGTK